MAQTPTDYAHAVKLADDTLYALLGLRSWSWVPALVIGVVASSVTIYPLFGAVLFLVAAGSSWAMLRILASIGIIAVMAWRVTLKTESEKPQSETKTNGICSQ